MKVSSIPIAAGSVRTTRWAGCAPPIMALHGFTGSGEDFGALCEHLPFEVVAPDLAGLPGSMDEVAASLALLRRQALPGPWVLLGYSMGGRIGLHLALSRPDPDLVGIVLVGASPGIADDGEREQRRREDHALAARIERSGTSAFADEWETKPLIASQAAIAPPWGQQLRTRRRQQPPAVLATALRHLGTGSMAPLWDRLERITVPVLLLTGEGDAKFTAIAAQMCRHISSCRHIVIPGAGHCAHLEQAAAAATAIRDFTRC